MKSEARTAESGDGVGFLGRGSIPQEAPSPPAKGIQGECCKLAHGPAKLQKNVVLVHFGA